ncbi:MAG: hypothetical protein IJN94_05115 [Clostridia bacterium]|nr:hypothetical protein [Clostridia bacterium]
MKYKVSLLPEQKKKRLINKKKLEKIKAFSLVVLIVLAFFTFVVMFTSFYAEKKLAEERQREDECAQQVAELEQFREINANLQNKVQLIESIQIEEPQLVNFVTKISNLKNPGISITSIECTEWKTTRNCVLVGTCDNRSQYLAFEEALKEVEGVSAVACASYNQSVGEATIVEFTVNVTCTGGVAVIETTTASTDTSTDTTAESTATE